MLPVAAVQSFPLKTSLDKTEQYSAVERLLEKVESVLSNRPDELGIKLVDAAGHENDIQCGIENLQLLQQLEPVHLGHLNIQDGEVGLECLGQPNDLAG